jgi:hypothetical protein
MGSAVKVLVETLFSPLLDFAPDFDPMSAIEINDCAAEVGDICKKRIIVYVKSF